MKTGAWGCWRNEQHRSSNFAWLVAKLLRLPYKTAMEMVYGEKTVDADSTVLHDVLNGLVEGDSKDEQTESVGVERLRMPQYFMSLNNVDNKLAPFRKYMRDRGFTGSSLSVAINRYKLKASFKGQFKFRIIIPIYFNKRLVNWTGRSIGNSGVRYMTLPKDESVMTTDRLIMNYDRLHDGGSVLAVTEGPMDFMKVDTFSTKGVRATCLFTKSITEEQHRLLMKVSRNFDRTVLLLDAGEEFDTFRKAEQLGIDPFYFPRDMEDPGALTREQVVALSGKLVNGADSW